MYGCNKENNESFHNVIVGNLKIELILKHHVGSGTPLHLLGTKMLTVLSQPTLQKEARHIHGVQVSAMK